MHPKEQGGRSLCPPRTGVTARLGRPSREPDRFPDPLIVWFLATTVRILSVRRIRSVVRDGVVCVSGTLSKCIGELTCIYFISEEAGGVGFLKKKREKERKMAMRKKGISAKRVLFPEGIQPEYRIQIDQLDLSKYFRGAGYEQLIRQTDTLSLQRKLRHVGGATWSPRSLSLQPRLKKR